jgi:hypothetical protein
LRGLDLQVLAGRGNVTLESAAPKAASLSVETTPAPPAASKASAMVVAHFASFSFAVRYWRTR